MQVGKGQLAAVGIHTGVDCGKSHSVADQKDDVADFSVASVILEIRSV